MEGVLNVELLPAESGGSPLQVDVQVVRRHAEEQPVVGHSFRHGRHDLGPAVISPVLKAAREDPYARQADLLVEICGHFINAVETTSLAGSIS